MIFWCKILNVLLLVFDELRREENGTEQPFGMYLWPMMPVFFKFILLHNLVALSIALLLVLRSVILSVREWPPISTMSSFVEQRNCIQSSVSN